MSEIVLVDEQQKDKIDKKVTWLSPDEKAKLLNYLNIPWEYLDHPFFNLSNPWRKIRSLPVSDKETHFEKAWNIILSNWSRNDNHQRIEANTLNATEEQSLFIRYNFIRKQVLRFLKAVLNNPTQSNVKSFLEKAQEALKLEHIIVSANLGLAISMYNKKFHASVMDKN